ncbi:MAG: beta-lactamase family protein [Theionarchaea archaeon]|nr:beta-lactamase family protein [Theionarchaea archaeon]
MKRNYMDIIEDFQKEIPEKMKKENIPGLAIALVSKKGLVWCGCFGVTDVSGRQAVNIDTLFSLQSTTKTVTTVAFLLAVQEGLVTLDDCVFKICPEFKVNSRFGRDQYKKITFRHLLSHTSGLVRESKVGGVFNYVPCTWEEHIEGINGTWLKFPVGKGIAYSNVGMDLVTYLLERITGESYTEYVQRVVGDPLGIHFHYNTREVYNTQNAAKGYLGEVKAAQIDPVGLGCGAASLSIQEQAVFVQFLLNRGQVEGDNVLNSALIDVMRSVDKEGWYGLGTLVNREWGISLSYHPGGGFGLRSEMYWLPEYDCGVAVFTNQEYSDYISVLAKNAVRRVLEAKGVPLRPAEFPFETSVKIDEALLKRLTGVYSGFWGTVSVNVRNGTIYLDYPDRAVELTPHNETAFSAESPKGVVFQVDDGEPVSLKMYSENSGILHMDYRGRPPESPGPHNPAWKAFAGLYHMNIYGTEPVFCGVKIEDDGYLHLKCDQSERLYQHEDVSNLFFEFNGTPVVFEKDHVWYDNVKWVRIDDPVTTITELFRSPEHCKQEWMVDGAASQLTYLGRDEETEKILNLK